MKSVSVTGKKWILKDFKNDDVNYIKNNFFLDEIISRLIAIKKIKKEEISNYLNPSIKNIMPNPNVLKDMEKTTKRIVKAILNNEKFGIFGDYDVDGATSSALLGRFFKSIGSKYEVYIPDRKSEGYGPTKKGFDKLISLKVNLIFTVDCGTLSFDAINYAYEKKIDVLVLDHHQSEINLPNAYSIINPNRFDDNSNLKYLCAVGVCFMFLASLNTALRNINWFKKNNIIEPNLIDNLDLVSLGTVCDVVPLVGLNRAIVKQGLKVIKSRKNIGLKTLIDICKIETDPKPHHLGYMIGPRINAGGRVGKCSHGANLLLNIDPKEVFKIASELNEFNKERQLLEKDLLNKILNEKIDNSKPVITLSGENWHEGIIGIIASRIKDKFNKPTIIISLKNELGKASARSIYGFDIGSIIISATQAGILLKGGGHKMAGGFSIKKDNIGKFKDFINKKFEKNKIQNDYERKIYFDGIILPSAVNLEFFKKIDNLSPFGSGNSEPKFLVENLKFINSTIVGDKHIKSILIAKDGTSIKTVAFNSVETNISQYLLQKKHKFFNILGKLSLNEWKGKKNVEFIIDDISVNK